MTAPYYSDDSLTLWHGDALAVLSTMPAGSVDCVVTSPPYFGLRDYGIDGQYGLEGSPAEYVETMRSVFAEARRALADDGTFWLNLGDSYVTGPSGPRTNPGTMVGSPNSVSTAAGMGDKRGAGLPAKNLLGIPWRVAFALQDDGWILRNDIIWHKPNAMPESVTDRLSGRHEHLFMLAKSPRYWFDLDAIRTCYSDRVQERQHYAGRDLTGSGWERKAQPGQHGNEAKGILGFGHAGMHESGRNPGDVWEIPTTPFSAAHFATFPAALAERCVKAGCKPDGTVLDPFSGSGTTGLAAARLGRRYVGIDLNAEYLDLSLRTRLAQTALFEGGAA